MEYPDVIVVDVTDAGFYLQAEWKEVLAALPKLRTLLGVDFLEDPSSPYSSQEDENDLRISFLARLAPRLEYIDHWRDLFVTKIIRKQVSEDFFEYSWKKVDYGVVHDIEVPDDEWRRQYCGVDS